MSSTFGSLNIAKTGLQYQQVAIDTANNNISNVNTDGYVRRRAVAAEIGGPGQPVMWSSYDGHGQGVTTQGVQRLSELLMDKRVRAEHSNLSYLQVQQASLERLESAIDEPSAQGVAKAMADFTAAWHDVVTSPDGSAARQSVVAKGQTLAAAINTQARSVDAEIDTQGGYAAQDLGAVNGDLQEMAQLNHAIFVAQATGADVGDLQDQRDLVALDLANKSGAVSTADPATGKFNVSLNGQVLVVGDKYAAIGSDGVGLNEDGTINRNSDGTPMAVGFLVSDMVNYDSKTPPDTSTGTGLVASPGGELGGIQTLLNVRLKDYRAQLNAVAQNVYAVVNTQHQQGFDLAGSQGAAFFAYDDSAGGNDYAGTLTVAKDLVDHPDHVAASSVGADFGAGNADAISKALSGGRMVSANGDPISAPDATDPSAYAIDIADQYRTMVAGLGAAASGLNTQATNQQLMTQQVDDEREQSAGVSIDEETINLMQAQRAYQASARVLSTMDSILDTLINHTGV